MSCRTALTLLLCAASLGAQGIPSRPEQLAFPPVTFLAPLAKSYRATLKNGITVYIAPDPGTAFVNIGLQVRYGSHLDPAGKAGLASLFGGLWRDGGTLLTPAAELDEKCAFLAASVGPGSLRCMAKDLDAGLKLMMEVLLQPAFAQERLDLHKRRARQGLDRRNDSAGSVHGYNLGFLLNGEKDHGSRPVTPASLDAITREDLLAFHKRVMHPGNMILTVSGAFEKKAMLARLETLFGELKPGPGAQVTPRPKAPSHQRQPGIYLLQKDVPQAVVSLTLPGLRRTDPDYFPAYVMNQILGGPAFTARLLKKVRSDEGLTYGITSSLGAGRAYGAWKGDWNCQFLTKNRSVPYALRLTLAEMARLQTEPVGEAELQVVKGSLIETFPGNFSSKSALVHLFANEELSGWPEDFYATYREKIQAVTPADIQRVARTYLDPAWAVLLVTGKLDEVKAGDSEHPGALADVLPLPVHELPQRNALTLKPVS
jgi:zinc protease